MTDLFCKKIDSCYYPSIPMYVPIYESMLSFKPIIYNIKYTIDNYARIHLYNNVLIVVKQQIENNIYKESIDIIKDNGILSLEIRTINFKEKLKKYGCDKIISSLKSITNKALFMMYKKRTNNISSFENSCKNILKLTSKIYIIDDYIYIYAKKSFYIVDIKNMEYSKSQLSKDLNVYKLDNETLCIGNKYIIHENSIKEIDVIINDNELSTISLNDNCNNIFNRYIITKNSEIYDYKNDKIVYTLNKNNPKEYQIVSNKDIGFIMINNKNGYELYKVYK